MERCIYKFEGKRIEKMNYLLHIPRVCKDKLPLIISLHGAGERGDDFDKIPVHGIAKYIEGGMELDAVVIAPQCPEGLVWNLLTFELRELIDFIIGKYNIDEDRVTITGLSMGGFGTWEMGMSYPGLFAALAPVCGGGMSWRVGNIGKTPVWAFHGDKDSVVPIENSKEMCRSLEAAGGNVRLTVFEGVDHNSWEPAYESTDLIQWLLLAKRK